MSRKEVIGRLLRQTADDLCDGSVAPILSYLVGKTPMSEDELEVLTRLVDRLDGQATESTGDEE